MQKLSVVIFSKDDLEQALEVIRDVYDITDEIVLMDASGKKQRDWMAGEKKRLKLEKLKIFRVIALGYREPLMTYALTKCKNQWVLDIETDMFPSEQLKRDIQKFMLDQRYDAYYLGIISVHSKRSNTFVSYQARLFRRDKIEFRGLLHEKPIIHGAFYTPTKKEYYIRHITVGLQHTAMDSYDQMRRFERFTYSEHNMRMLDQADRAARKSQPDTANLSMWKKTLLATLKLYEAMGFKKENGELSNFDYFTTYLVREVAHKIRKRSIRGIAASFPVSLNYLKNVREWRTDKYGDDDFRIAGIINKMGVVKYLGLDNPRVVDALNRKYLNKKQGVELLIGLLREKYERTRRSDF